MNNETGTIVSAFAISFCPETVKLFKTEMFIASQLIGTTRKEKLSSVTLLTYRLQ